MRYLFRGQRRDSGEPVEGRVAASTWEAACSILDDNGISADLLEPEPAAAHETGMTGTALQDDAPEGAGVRVVYDPTTRRYRGESVRGPGGDEIREQVRKLVETLHDRGDRRDAQRRITEALEKILNDQQTLSERSAASQALEAHVSRLSGDLRRMERAMASMSLAVRREGRGTPRRAAPAAPDRARDEVLLEIFESNLELMKGWSALSPAGSSS